jgi:hypothetical protein
MNELQPLSLLNIQGGELVEEANRVLETVDQDVMARSLVNDARTILIKIKIAPCVDPQSGLNQPLVDWSVSHTIPGRKGMQTRAIVHKNQIKVNVDSLMNPLQNSLIPNEKE